MSTNVYGASDDLVEFDGDVCGEVGCFGTDEPEHPGVLLVFSDGTLAVAKYGKAGMGVWGITLIAKGTLYDNLEVCSADAADEHSDMLIFKDGLRWAYAAKSWERVK